MVTKIVRFFDKKEYKCLKISFGRNSVCIGFEKDDRFWDIDD
jgi:hypothetical protein